MKYYILSINTPFTIDKNLVCSLGTLCHSAVLIHRNKLRTCAYPFDWVFSDHETVSDCLDNNFQKFLDKTYYADPKTVMFGGTHCGHSIYHPDFFFHKNPMKNEADYAYYTRCVTRFNNLLQNERTKLFITVIVPHGTQHPTNLADSIFKQNCSIEDAILNTKNNFLNLNEKLKKFAKNFYFLVIFAVPNSQKNEHEFMIDGNFHFLKLNTIGLSNGIGFLNENDNLYLDEVFKNTYNFC